MLLLIIHVLVFYSAEIKVKEHFHDVKYKDIEKSTVAYHFWIMQHKVEN